MNMEPITRRFVTAIAFATTILATATPAFAHSANKRLGDFYGGILHPITAVEHLFPIIALSLLAGQQGPRWARWIVLAFPIGLLVGAIIGTYTGPYDYIAWMNKISFVVLGILVAAAARVPFSCLVLISLLFGATHGYENTADVSQTVNMGIFLPGILVSGLSLVAIVAAIAVSFRLPWQKIAVRVAGSWIAAIGLLAIGTA